MPMKRIVAFALLIGIASCKGSDMSGPAAPGTVSVTFSGGTVTALIASTSTARANGLMNVASLGANSGMLFAWGTNHDSLDVSFYMKDTPIPLSIAFINANMVVVNVDEMVAEDAVTHHKPKGTFRYALEANKGWMTAHGVQAGSTVSFTLPAGTVTDP